MVFTPFHILGAVAVAGVGLLLLSTKQPAPPPPRVTPEQQAALDAANPRVAVTAPQSHAPVNNTGIGIFANRANVNNPVVGNRPRAAYYFPT